MLRDSALEALASKVVHCGFQIHQQLRPGLLESAYETLLAEALRQEGVSSRRQVSLSMSYQRVFVENAYRVDLFVEDKLIVEIKSVERLLPVHSKQVLTYLRLSDLPLGLLMNFGQPLFKDGMKRIANDYYADEQ